MSTRTRWTWLWLGWLVAFLSVEIPAAARKGGGTLSETVWGRWFPRRWQRVLIGAFGFEVFVVHFADAAQHWWSGGPAVIALALPVASCIAWAERGAVVGLGSLVGDVKHLLTLKALRDRLKEAGKMGHLRVALYAVVGAVGTALVAQITGACPGLIAAAPAILTAGIGSVVTYYMRRPLEAPATKATLAGAVALAVATVGEQLKITCGADFLHQLPTLALASVWVGVGLYLRAPHEAPGLGSVTPPGVHE